jgi:mannose/fructose/N-acetylgalactosamine-specific phosphotransferase system component IID
MQRYLSFFNTHPYFVSFALGALARLEEDHVNGRLADTEQINKFKNALIGPLGAIGDQLFWGTIKPASILVVVTTVMIIPQPEFKLLFLALFLILYNMPHLYIRYYGLREGYRLGYQIYKKLRIENFNSLRKSYHLIGAITIGVIVGFLMINVVNTHLTDSVIFAISFLGAIGLKKLKQGLFVAVLIPLLITFIIGMLSV